MIGKFVTVIIDRPLGSYHPEHKNIYYSVNYGYVESMIVADGEYQDAYVLGVDRPLREFRGKVIAVIHRLNDVEDKLVVAPENISLTEQEIKDAVDFQERYFSCEIRLR